MNALETLDLMLNRAYFDAPATHDALMALKAAFVAESQQLSDALRERDELRSMHEASCDCAREYWQMLEAVTAERDKLRGAPILTESKSLGNEPIPTPETDAAAFECQVRDESGNSRTKKCVAADFARDLERRLIEANGKLAEVARERDEAKMNYEGQRVSEEAAVAECNRMLAKLDEVTKEWDGRLTRIGISLSCTPVESAIHARIQQELRAALAAITAERDEMLRRIGANETAQLLTQAAEAQCEATARAQERINVVEASYNKLREKYERKCAALAESAKTVETIRKEAVSLEGVRRTLTRERDTARNALAESDAGAAALRELLQRIATFHSEDCEISDEMPCNCGSGALGRSIDVALDSTVGRDLLARLEGAEKELDAEKEEHARTARNRDMWKGQCERQTEALTDRFTLRQQLAKLNSEYEAGMNLNSALNQQLAEAVKWQDSPLPEDPHIAEAHPAQSGDHETFSEALRMVSARHSKYALASLVNWFMHLCREEQQGKWAAQKQLAESQADHEQTRIEKARAITSEEVVD